MTIAPHLPLQHYYKDALDGDVQDFHLLKSPAVNSIQDKRVLSFFHMTLALRLPTCIQRCLSSIACHEILPPSGTFPFLSPLSHSMQIADFSLYCHNNKQQFSHAEQPLLEVTILHLRKQANPCFFMGTSLSSTMGENISASNLPPHHYLYLENSLSNAACP